jgi:hypothetical protein
MGGHDHHGRIRIVPPQRAQHGQPVAIRQPDIQQHRVGRVRAREAQRFLGVAGMFRDMAGGAQIFGIDRGERGGVLHQEDPGGRVSHARPAARRRYAQSRSFWSPV